MKKVKLFEQFIAEGRNGVGKYNTVKKAMKAIRNEYGPTPTPQSVAAFITDNYYDVTEVERGDDDPRANDKIADLVATYKFDIEEWEIAWEDAQNESVVTEAVSRATKIYQIATPAPKAMLVGELEDLFGDDYRHIVTEFDDDERYESVLVFNLTKSDIKRIQEEIGDVLIWEYSIKKGKEISESAMVEALSKSDRKALAYTMAEQDPSKIKDLQDAIGQEFSDNYSSTNRSVLVDVKKKGGKWVAITSETESEYNNKKPKKGKREATIGITWNAMFF